MDPVALIEGTNIFFIDLPEPALQQRCKVHQRLLGSDQFVSLQHPLNVGRQRRGCRVDLGSTSEANLPVTLAKRRAFDELSRSPARCRQAASRFIARRRQLRSEGADVSVALDSMNLGCVVARRTQVGHTQEKKNT